MQTAKSTTLCLGRKSADERKLSLLKKKVRAFSSLTDSYFFFCLCILTFGGGDGILILTWKQGKRSIIVEKIQLVAKA